MEKKRLTGFWILMAPGIFILIMLLAGQTMSFIDYDFAVSIGLQESVDTVGEIGVAVNKGFGVGDTLIYLPLLSIGLTGLWLRREWGIFAMAGALAITSYWPVVSIFFLFFAKSSPGFIFNNFTLYTVVLTPISSYGIWGLFYLYKNRNLLTDK